MNYLFSTPPQPKEKTEPKVLKICIEDLGKQRKKQENIDSLATRFPPIPARWINEDGELVCEKIKPVPVVKVDIVTNADYLEIMKLHQKYAFDGPLQEYKDPSKPGKTFNLPSSVKIFHNRDGTHRTTITVPVKDALEFGEDLVNDEGYKPTRIRDFEVNTYHIYIRHPDEKEKNPIITATFTCQSPGIFFGLPVHLEGFAHDPSFIIPSNPPAKRFTVPDSQRRAAVEFLQENKWIYADDYYKTN